MKNLAGRVTARRLAPVASMGAVALVASGVALAGHLPAYNRPGQSGTRHPAGHPMDVRHAPLPADPAFVAVFGESGQGMSQAIRLISPRTGRLIKVLSHLGTGNGFALSPDSRRLFVVGPTGKGIVIRQISVATGRVSYIADGAYPAVSPNSRYLAYATGSRAMSEVAVRNLRTGVTRVISLRRLIGRDSGLLNQGAITWLGDGTEVLAVPQPDGIAVSTGASGFKLRGTRCGLQDSPRGLCVIAIKITPGGLTAQPFFVPWRWSRYAMVISGDYSAQRSFLIARWGGRPSGAIDRVTLIAAGVAGRQVGRLPGQALPGALAPDGDRILYILGHRPPALWLATIRNGHLIRRHLLITDNNHFGVDNEAW
jgi:hypothetical protein